MQRTSFAGWVKRGNSQVISLGTGVILLSASITSALPLLVTSSANADTMPIICTTGSADQAAFSSVPTLLTPANDSIDDNGFSFSWSAITGASNYDWESSLTPDATSDGSFVNQLAYHQLSDTSINEGNSPENTYYWHIRGVDANGVTGPWSQIWKVTINSSQTSYLSAPVLTSPDNGAICNIAEQDFYFTWNVPTSDDGSALTYQYQSGRSADTDPNTGDFIDQPWNASNLTDTTITDGESVSGVYYWHVRAISANGVTGPWSETRVVNIVHETTPPPIVKHHHHHHRISDNTGAGNTTPKGDDSNAETTTPNISIAAPTTVAPPMLTVAPIINGSAVLSITTSSQNNQKPPTKPVVIKTKQTAVKSTWMAQNGLWVIFVTLFLSLTATSFDYFKTSKSTK